MTIRHITVHAIQGSDGPTPDLVGLLTVLAREGIRMRTESIRLRQCDAGGSVDYEFKGGRVDSDVMPGFLFTLLRENWSRVMPRVVQELHVFHGLSARFVGNQLLVSNSAGVQTVIEIVV